jgi:hypothetical protein
MSILIADVLPATVDGWDSIWRECEYSTYFHSREWAELWSVYTEAKTLPNPKLVVFSDGKKALLPLSYGKYHKGLTTSYLSSPGGTFGGWISTDELSVAHAILLGDYMTRKLGNLFWRMNPYDELALKAGMRISEEDETQALDLSGGFDAIYKDWTKGHSSAARKARKARRLGVSVKLASTLDDWCAYYKVYEDSIRRWGDRVSSVYGWRIFDEMFRRDSPAVKLWLSLYQSEVVAGALCLYAKNHAVYWHGAASEAHFHLRPVNLLMYEIIEDACERNCASFDFNPSGGHEGVRAFKRSFGAKDLRCPIVTVQTAWARFASNAAFAVRALTS